MAFVQQVIPFTISSHRIGQVIFVSEVTLFSCLITVLICIKNPSLFDPCINISNKVILVFSCIALCFYCFYVISMFHFYCIGMYIDVRLWHPNKDYLLTYLQFIVRSSNVPYLPVPVHTVFTFNAFETALLRSSV